jgi:hypothetical protein
MGRILTITAVVAALAVPAALADKPPSKQTKQTAAQECKAQLKSMGTKDFRSLWGNLGHCVALTAQQNQENVESAEEQCRAARADDTDAFAGKWGHGRNAFGKCVSQTAKAMAQEQHQETMKAAQACKAERTKDPAAFRTTYGKGKRNAFANCVKQKKAESG